jgi:hypothetical protein
LAEDEKGTAIAGEIAEDGLGAMMRCPKKVSRSKRQVGKN